jgi:hypothetical protein
LTGIILEAGARAARGWSVVIVARCLAAVAIRFAALTFSLTKLALSAASFTVRIWVWTGILSREAKLTLYLLHTSTVILVCVVGGRWRVCLARFLLIWSIRIAVRSRLAVVWSRLRARRLRRRLVVWCARYSGLARSVARLVSLATFKSET